MSREINKPENRTFWRTSGNDNVVHEGVTEIGQQTTTGQKNMTSHIDASKVYPPLPSELGTWLKEGVIYSYEKDSVIVRHPHRRTIYPPSETPNLFGIIRANTSGLEWIPNEDVIRGDKKTCNGKNYKCLKSHFTITGEEPPAVPTLWKVFTNKRKF